MAGSHDKLPITLLMLCLLTPTSHLQADYQSGLDAYLVGDYSTAMKDWRAVAAGSRLDETPNIYAETHYAIAMLYWEGLGVPQDFIQAHEWLAKAAAMNHAGAQAKLGYMYTEGIVVPRDLARAFEWYGKAARQGDVDGQYNLGVFYYNGWGTEQDTTMAKQYLAAASAQGDQAAEQALQQLTGSVEANSFAKDAQVNSSTSDDLTPIANKSDPTVDSDAAIGAKSLATFTKTKSAPTIETDAVVGANSVATFTKSKPVSPDRETEPLLHEKSWILAQNPDHYTLQVIALSARERVETLVQGYESLAPFAIYTPRTEGKPLYVLLQGNYPDVDSARAARDAFPSAIQKADKLWIRQFGMIQEPMQE